MPKLYHNGGIEGWQIPGEQDKTAKRIDVPSSPAILAAWLNHRRVGPTGAAAEQERADEQLERVPSRSDPFGELQGKTKDPPRLAPRFLGDLAAGVEFVPVARAAEIDRLLDRCPQCHHTVLAALAERVRELPLDQLQHLAEVIREHVGELTEQLEERSVQ